MFQNFFGQKKKLIEKMKITVLASWATLELDYREYPLPVNPHVPF